MSAQAEPAAARGALYRRGLRGLAGAVAFLTIVPIPRRARFMTEGFDLADAAPWFPLVGGAIGALAGALRVALDPVLGRGPSTAIAMAAIVVLTGALHQDGLADMSDGLGVRGDRARKLAVMRESTVGAFGVLALIIWALLLFTALDGLSAEHAVRALVTAGAVGRLGAVLHAASAESARRDGLGAGMRITRSGFVLAVMLAAGVSVAAAGVMRAGLSVAVCAVIAGLSAALARRAFGGSTGDTLGAAVAVTEVAACVALLATWR